MAPWGRPRCSGRARAGLARFCGRRSALGRPLRTATTPLVCGTICIPSRAANSAAAAAPSRVGARRHGGPPEGERSAKRNRARSRPTASDPDGGPPFRSDGETCRRYPYLAAAMEERAELGPLREPRAAPPSDERRADARQMRAPEPSRGVSRWHGRLPLVRARDAHVCVAHLPRSQLLGPHAPQPLHIVGGDVRRHF